MLDHRMNSSPTVTPDALDFAEDHFLWNHVSKATPSKKKVSWHICRRQAIRVRQTWRLASLRGSPARCNAQIRKHLSTAKLQKRIVSWHTCWRPAISWNLAFGFSERISCSIRRTNSSPPVTPDALGFVLCGAEDADNRKHFSKDM